MSSNQIVIINPCLRIIGNITHGDDQDTDMVIEAGVLDHLTQLLTHHHKIIRMETCWIISNITAGTSSQLDKVIRNDQILSKLIHICTQDHIDVKREAVWAICNSTKKASPDQINHLLENGLLELMIFFLDTNKTEDTPSKILNVILEAIIEILQTGKEYFTDNKGNNRITEILLDKGIVEHIEKLQQHPNESIYTKTYKILSEFFEEEEIL